ncbi:hypothetical protein L3Y34_012458 [Caenorhabditis briggsae]|uniref:SET domain-containing protein n=1 Tax=Caenorhabditis briggsae TaxID=6238 RepID=A0AAE9CVV3_CAEBR|nr:hypothetical protein L3Y34_012458 [Caenorhabditis briggsae]
MINRPSKAPKDTKNQEAQNVKKTIKKFHANVQPKLHPSYKADKAKVVRVEKCKNEDCNCTTEDCDNYGQNMAGRFYIDPTKYGNSARFGNHSCEPNMHAKTYTVSNRKNGFKAIGFVANKNIRKGAELTIDYGYNYNPETSQRCLCRKRKCKGWIGQPPPAAIHRNDGQNRQTELETANKNTVSESELMRNCKYVLDKILANVLEAEEPNAGASTTNDEEADANLQDDLLEVEQI